MPESIRVLIADDHALFREGVSALLAAEPDIEVVAGVATGAQAAQRTLELQPDVVLMDIQMPDLNGLDATRLILRDSPHVRVLMLTMFEDDDTIFSAVRAGARGYVIKGADGPELVRAIRAVGAGEALFGGQVADRLLTYMAHTTTGISDTAFPELTQREQQILGLIATGLNNGQIAERLGISSKTVRNHVSNVFSKLQVVDRAQAIILARDAGLR